MALDPRILNRTNVLDLGVTAAMWERILGLPSQRTWEAEGLTLLSMDSATMPVIGDSSWHLRIDPDGCFVLSIRSRQGADPITIQGDNDTPAPELLCRLLAAMVGVPDDHPITRTLNGGAALRTARIALLPRSLA